MMHRREWLKQCTEGVACAALAGSAARSCLAAERPDQPFALTYILASPLYGTTPLTEVLPEVKKSGARYIDLWPRVHANHREQVEEMGHERFAELLARHEVQLGMTTRYDLGPYGCDGEVAFIKKFGGQLLVTGAERHSGTPTKEDVRRFVERLQPHVAVAEQNGVTLAIENHGGFLLKTIDAIRWFGEFAKSSHLGLALAPAHLPQDAEQLARLIDHLGPKLVHFYAWQAGDGFLTKLPKAQELKQLPGRGPLDFAPLLAALQRARYDGWVEIFMHPTPRGEPILDSTTRVTDAVNESRTYLEQRLASTVR